jgi:predicted aspartyl protease
MHGHVRSERRAMIPIRVKGIGGVEISADAILDTGFSDYLALPDILIEQLDLRARDKVEVVLADGTEKLATEYSARVYWDDEWQRVPVQVTRGEAALVLVGMGLLFNHYVTMELVDGGTVSAELIE